MFQTLRYTCALLTATLAWAGPGLERVPLTFEVNSGQSASPAAFVARGAGYSLQFTAAGVEMRLAHPDAAPEAVGMRFANRMGLDWVELENRLPHQANYLRGADARAWRTGVAQYERLRYRGLYRGIDAVFYGNQRQFEYDFIVAPGADPSEIELEFTGARARIGAGGELDLRTGHGQLLHHAPVVYQERDGRRIPVQGRYRPLPAGRIGFALGAYDRSLPLVIDPVMQYSSFLGGKAPNGAYDIAYATAVDPDGNIYLAGRTSSSDFPLQGAMQAQNKGSGDAFVIKLDPSGRKVLYSTFLGGGSLEHAYALVVDAHGQAHIAGQTGSVDFPVKNAHQTRKTGLNNVFVAKLNAAGNGLIFSTFMGGDRNDVAHGIALDRYGNVFVAGFTNSSNFPTYNALQPKHSGGGADGLLAKFDPEGKLMFSTHIGKQTEIYALAVDEQGSAYMTGTVMAAGLATPNAFQTRLFPRDAFVAKVTSDGAAFAYFTYLGANGTDEGHAIAVDAAGNAYVAGYAGSREFPTTNGVVQSKMSGNSDAFVTKINPLGTGIIWSTFLGGSANTPSADDESIKGIAVDADGCVYVTGSTLSADFPVNRATQTRQAGRRDVFLTKLNAQAGQIIFSTFIGGAQAEDAYGLTVTPLRAMLVTGQTFSADYPVERAFSDTLGSNTDSFLTRVCDPVMFLSGAGFDFTWTQGTDLPERQQLTVTACRDLELTLDKDAEWLTTEAGVPAGGVSAVALGLKPEALEPGEYTATVKVSHPDVYFGAQTVTVRMRVLPPPPPPEN